ncbi:MAG TPA: hypothetical protein VFZ09_27370 [Archangium sp.]|uniref:hypothetical protein n=1 Tax=Archangium sp. TaxID=1872627 RepID=UPI002E331D20|nr:hypothetical protein [Archangium sp.]HEX5749980.1 hypothetical protein [Archangium sp.]
MSTMDPRERAKKPEPERTQPIRNWTVLFPGTPPRTPPPGAAPPSGEAVSRGVEMGYRVIEEYLRQGQNVARAMGGPSSGGGAPADDGLQNRMGAMLRSFTDFASLWMELMGRMGAGGAGSASSVAPPMGTAGPFPAGAAPAASEPPRAEAPAPPVVPEPQAVAPLGLTLDIDSPRRVEVSLELRPRSSALPLVVHDLRAPEPDKPRITGVEIECLPEEERVVLHLRVAEAHPPGVYSGLIVDERTGLPRGTLTVRIPPR